MTGRKSAAGRPQWTPTGGTLWSAMTPEMFDADVKPEQGSLFGPTVELVRPQPGPQLDLFGEEAK